MTDLEKIEELLREYPVLKSKLNIKIIQSENKVYLLPGINYTKVLTGDTNAFYSDIEEFVANKDELEGETLELFRKVKAIESGLRCLTRYEYMVVKLRYFKNMTYINIGLELNRSEKTISTYNKMALLKLQKAEFHKITGKFPVNYR